MAEVIIHDIDTGLSLKKSRIDRVNLSATGFKDKGEFATALVAALPELSPRKLQFKKRNNSFVYSTNQDTVRIHGQKLHLEKLVISEVTPSVCTVTVAYETPLFRPFLFIAVCLGLLAGFVPGLIIYMIWKESDSDSVQKVLPALERFSIILESVCKSDSTPAPEKMKQHINSTQDEDGSLATPSNPESTPRNEKQCLQCHTPSPMNMAFCGNCGEPLSESPTMALKADQSFPDNNSQDGWALGSDSTVAPPSHLVRDNTHRFRRILQRPWIVAIATVFLVCLIYVSSSANKNNIVTASLTPPDSHSESTPHVVEQNNPLIAASAELSDLITYEFIENGYGGEMTISKTSSCGLADELGCSSVKLYTVSIQTFHENSLHTCEVTGIENTSERISSNSDIDATFNLQRGNDSSSLSLNILFNDQHALIEPAGADSDYSAFCGVRGNFLGRYKRQSHAHLKTSFSCNAELTNVEQLICSNADLAHLDVEVSKRYERLRTNGEYVASQRRWLAQRNQCLDAACLYEAYRQRLDFLPGDSTQTSEDLYRTGRRLANESKYKEAYAVWLPQAVSGDPKAQMGLAKLYLRGDGLARDYVQGFYWTQKAAVQNNPEAQHYLGRLYRNGDGTAPDLEKSAYWFRKAEENGYQK